VVFLQLVIYVRDELGTNEKYFVRRISLRGTFVTQIHEQSRSSRLLTMS